jgi:RNase H-fold protein (predicted Holliday junction resolvase)
VAAQMILQGYLDRRAENNEAGGDL